MVVRQSPRTRVARRSDGARRVRGATALLAAFLIACGDRPSPTPTAPPTLPPAANESVDIQGDPESPQGATWTYAATRDGVVFDLQGILLKPRGSGPFPAVIVSHGAGGSATGYSRAVASEMVQWGLVAIATNYTHAGGMPLGSPGTSADAGASQPNVLRANAAYRILRTLSYVDGNRIAAHGHSMGAFVTTALVAAYPHDFRAASHTAGGVRPDSIVVAALPTESQARGIRTPYQMHHGDADAVVPLLVDQLLASVLRGAGVPHELHVYAGAAHNDPAQSASVYARIRAWYAAHGVL